MSEQTTEIQTPEVDTPVADQAPASTPEVTTPEPVKYDYVPPKFLKEDGTPDFERLAKSYTGLEKKLGSKPNIPASSVDEYVYDFGEGFEVDEARATEFKTKAFEKGFTKAQYEFVMESHKAVIDAMEQEIYFSPEKTEAALKQAWGKDYDAQAKAARAGYDEFASSESNPHDPVWNHPEVMKLLARIGGELGEDSLSNKKSSVSGDSIDQQIAELRKDPNYFKDPAIQAKANALYEKKYG
ncbi:MAG: hypothetical protein Q7T13_01625 [Polaromonas sp.]|nr:hypothetical protein [Polaromonas sp.]